MEYIRTLISSLNGCHNEILIIHPNNTKHHFAKWWVSKMPASAFSDNSEARAGRSWLLKTQGHLFPSQNPLFIESKVVDVCVLLCYSLLRVVCLCVMVGRRGRRQGGEINLSGLNDSLLKGIGVPSHTLHRCIRTVIVTLLLTPQPPTPSPFSPTVLPPLHLSSSWSLTSIK